MKTSGDLLRSGQFSLKDDHGNDVKTWLFKRIEAFTGLEFSSSSRREFLGKGMKAFNCEFPFHHTDLVEINAQVKATNIADRAEGLILKAEAKAAALNKEGRNAKHLYKLCVEKLESALVDVTNDSEILRNLAEALLIVGKIPEAKQYLDRALELNDKDPNTLWKVDW
jgi:hypothetical protein